jgi:glyoxylase-like metal-dependent hydrolase (beta-lactamase superfamily II)
MTITLGEIRIERVAELDHWTFPATDLFPSISGHLCGGPDAIDLTITTHLIRTPGRAVLVDSGNGNDKQRPTLLAHHMFATDYLDRLTATGTRPEDVDVVVSTHLHPDHCGGNTRLVEGRWVPTFPRARYLFARAEFSWLQQLHAARPAEGVEADLARTFEDSILPVVDAGQAVFVDLPHEVTSGVTLHALPGHTAGHLVVEVTGAGQRALVTGDIIHHPLQFADLTLSQAGDADPDEAARSRRTLCRWAADTSAIVLPAHFGGPVGGRIERRGESFGFMDEPGKG